MRSATEKVFLPQEVFQDASQDPQGISMPLEISCIHLMVIRRVIATMSFGWSIESSTSLCLFIIPSEQKTRDELSVHVMSPVTHYASPITNLWPVAEAMSYLP